MLIFTLSLAGAVALLLWSVRLIRTGVERAFSVELRKGLRRSSEQRAIAAGTGTLAALMLQSSTAVAMLVASFCAAGTIAARTSLAMMFGADLGSALVAQVLMVRVSWLVPLLLLLGVTLFLRGKARKVRQSGRMLVGLALVFVSLTMIRTATAPLGQSQAVIAVAHYLAGDPVTALVLGALFAWAVHSSVAAVIVVVTLAGEGLLPVDAAMALVFGANVGGSVIPMVLTLGGPPRVRRVVAANLLVRGGGAALALVGVTLLHPDWSFLGSSEHRQVLNVHLLFNFVVLLIGLPLVGPLLSLLERVFSEKSAQNEPVARLSALDPAAFARPERALGCARREILRLGEEVEAMLARVIRLFATWDDALADSIHKSQVQVNKMHLDIKLYLARLQRETANEECLRKSMELWTISANFEGAGDTVDKDMLGLARRIQRENLTFSEAGWKEICDFHDRVLSNVQLALNVLVTADIESARQLVEEKDQVRDVEKRLQQAHLERLRSANAESIDTSNIHQETVRALKEVNSAFTMVAYPILAESGELLSSRLATPERETKPGTTTPASSTR